MRADQENTWPLFAFAGLWRHYQVEMQDPDSDRDNYTGITTMANALIEPIHPTRTPAIFSPQLYDILLHGTEQHALRLLKPFTLLNKALDFCLMRFVSSSIRGTHGRHQSF